MINNHSEKSSSVSVRKSIFIYVMVSLFLAFEMAVQVSPSVMVPELMRDLNIGAFTLGIISSVYFYSYTVMQIPSGLLFDRYEARSIIFFAVMTCSIGSILFGYTSSFYFACLARLFMGIGSAFAFVSVLVVASRLFDSKWFSMITGITQMLAAFGAMSGQLPISVLVENYGWRHTMFILGIIGIILAIIISILLGNNSLQCNKPIHSNNKYKSHNIKSSLKLILSNPQSWCVALYACLLWAPMSGFASLWGVVFLSKFDSLTATSAALYCSMMWLGLALGSPALGVFSTYVKNKVVPLMVSAAIGVVAFGAILGVHMHGFLLMLALFLSGSACSGQALSFSLVTENNPDEIKGTAIAFNNMAVVISGIIFQPFIGWLLHNSTGYSSTGFVSSMFVIFIAYLVAFMSAMFLIKNPERYNVPKRHKVSAALSLSIHNPT